MSVDLRVLSRQLGLLSLVLSAALVVIALFGLGSNLLIKPEGYTDVYAALLAAGIGCIAGLGLIFSGRATPELIGRREALLLVALSWILGGVLAALPFWIWALLQRGSAPEPHPFESFVNCYFEAVSGLTTAGSTILTAIGTVPRSLLLWRSATQWLGGVGIVVLFVAILPLLGVGGRRILRIEAGAARQGVRPQIRDAARALWLIYVGLTVAGTVGLRLCGMSWFDALNHTFTGLATGGFSTQDASLGAYSSTAIHLVTIGIMLAGSINFVLYHQVIQGKWRSAIRDPEFRVFLAIYGLGVLIVTTSLVVQTPAAYIAPDGQRVSLWIQLRDAAFQVASIQSTTGFATADFDLWGFPAKATLLLGMFLGGCVGATTGGIKISRIMIAAKLTHEELERAYQSTLVRATTIGKVVIPADIKINTLILILLYAATFGAGTAALMVSEGSDKIDITTAATATAATMNTTGPGLALVGPTRTFNWFSGPGKLIMCGLMILGRLEIFTIVVLFLPRFWRTA